MHENSPSFEDDVFFDDGEAEGYLLDDDEPADPNFSAGFSRSRFLKSAALVCLTATAIGGSFYAYNNSSDLLPSLFNKKQAAISNSGPLSSNSSSSNNEENSNVKESSAFSAGSTKPSNSEPFVEKTGAVETPSLDKEIAAQSDSVLTPFPNSVEALSPLSTLASLDIPTPPKAEEKNVSQESVAIDDDLEKTDSAQARIDPADTSSGPVVVREEENVASNENASRPDDVVETFAAESEKPAPTQNLADDHTAPDSQTPPFQDAPESDANVLAEATQDVESDDVLGETVAEAVEKIEPVASADFIAKPKNVFENQASDTAESITPIKISALPASAIHALNQKPLPLKEKQSEPEEKQSVSQDKDVQKTINAGELWQISGAQPGKAVLKNLKSGELISVETGNIVRGLGTIKSVGRINGQWVVKGSEAALKR